MEIQTVQIVFYVFMLECAKAEIFDKTFEADLDRFINKTMDCRRIPGLTLSVVKDSVTWSRGYGFADLSQGRMVDENTRFNIGSVTKSFTMVLLGILLTQKGLDWDTKLHDILGLDYEFIDEIRSEQTTLRDMLSHRTGLARLDIGLLAGYPNTVTREKLSANMKYFPEERPFRDTFIYNNYVFMMLGHVTEKLGGDTWENLVTTKVLRPIGMTSTRILNEPKNILEEGVAQPYILKDNKLQNGTFSIYSLNPLEPAGAILSTGKDMAKYIQFHLKLGTTEDGKSLLAPKLLLDAYTSKIPVLNSRHSITRPMFPVSDVAIGYGHAFISSTYRGYRKIWHNGGLFSYMTQLWMYPDINAGIYASVNGPGIAELSDSGLKTIFYFISDKLLAEEPWLNDTITCEFPQPWYHKNTVNSTSSKSFGKFRNPSEYVGVYGSHFLPEINVSANAGDDSALSFQMNKLSGILHSTKDKDKFLMEVTSPWEYMTLFVNENNNTIMLNSTFLRNKENVVTSLEIQYEVKVVYTKGVSIMEDSTSGQAPGSNLVRCHFVVFALMIRFVLFWRHNNCD